MPILGTSFWTASCGSFTRTPPKLSPGRYTLVMWCRAWRPPCPCPAGGAHLRFPAPRTCASRALPQRQPRQGLCRRGRAEGSARAPAPGANPRAKQCRGARGSAGFQPHISFGRPAKGPCRFRLLIGDSAGGRAWAKLCPDPPPSDRHRVQLSQSRAGVTGSTSSLPAVPFLALSVSETPRCAGDGDTSAWLWPLPTATRMEPTGKEPADKQAP